MNEPYLGQVFFEIGFDEINGIYLFAYAFIEDENKDSWKWFLKHFEQYFEMGRN